MNPPQASQGQLAVHTVRCPSCGQPSVFGPSNPYRPFCTEVCKNIDLGAWASEQFRVEATPPNPNEPDHT
jgi:endogenous inhibitor of DNA gyrase (YacG/DUF329 family)